MIGLLDLYDEHPEALEHELITLGLRWRDLGTPRLSWRDLKVIVSQAPATGALTRARYPEEFLRFERYLEVIHYQLAVANVQRGTQSGARREDFPSPPEWAVTDRTQFGKKPLPVDEMAEWLGGDFVALLPH